jgi:hypothetical protein
MVRLRRYEGWVWGSGGCVVDGHKLTCQGLIINK